MCSLGKTPYLHTILKADYLLEGTCPMLNPRYFLLIPVLAAVLGAVSPSNASAQQVQVTAQTLDVQENGGFADVQFRITVTNGESLVASNVQVAFDDAVQVTIGDVA